MTSNTTSNSTWYGFPPSNTYGGVLNNNVTSVWPQYDPNGTEITTKINQMLEHIQAYRNLIGGVVYQELIDKLVALSCNVTQLWPSWSWTNIQPMSPNFWGTSVGTTSTTTNTYNVDWTYIPTTTTNGTAIAGTYTIPSLNNGVVWVY